MPAPVGVFPNQSNFEDSFRNLNLVEKEQAVAEQHTQYDVVVLLEFAQDLPPQTSGLPSFSIVGKDYLRQNFRVHAEQLSRKPAVSEPPAEFARPGWCLVCVAQEADWCVCCSARAVLPQRTRGAPQSDDRRPCKRCCEERRCADGAAVAGVPGNWILTGPPCKQVHGGFEGVLALAHQGASEVLEADRSSNNGDFETHTRWLRAVASLSEAERVIFVGARTSALFIAKVVGKIAEELSHTVESDSCASA